MALAVLVTASAWFTWKMLMQTYLRIAVGAVFACFCLSASAQDDHEVERLYDRAVQHDRDALRALEQRARSDDPAALTALGFMYEQGVGVDRDIARSMENYARACSLGGQSGCANAAYFYEFGIGIEKDARKAARYIAGISKDGIEDATELERQWRIVYKGKADAEADAEMRPQVIGYLKRHVGSASRADRLVMERIGFSKLDLLRLARVWAEQSDDPALLFQIGSFYNFGYAHVEEKNVEALKWWRRAAEAGEAQSQNLLGLAYLNGRWGVERDQQLAIGWFERASEQKDKDALINLGEIYYLGERVPVDYARALSLFEQAERLGVTRASRFLTWMYYNGQSVATDCQKALHHRQVWRRQAPDEQGDAMFLAHCKRDQESRALAAQAKPVLTLQHMSTFHGGQSDAVACEPHFVVTTDKIGEVANLRVLVELINDSGTVSPHTLAFSPFGLNTINEGLDGRENDSFSASAPLSLRSDAFCRFNDYRIKEAAAVINGRRVDLLAEGILMK